MLAKLFTSAVEDSYDVGDGAGEVWQNSTRFPSDQEVMEAGVVSLCEDDCDICVRVELIPFATNIAGRVQHESDHNNQTVEIISTIRNPVHINVYRSRTMHR